MKEEGKVDEEKEGEVRENAPVSFLQNIHAWNTVIPEFQYNFNKSQSPFLALYLPSSPLPRCCSPRGGVQSEFCSRAELKKTCLIVSLI